MSIEYDSFHCATWLLSTFYWRSTNSASQPRQSSTSQLRQSSSSRSRQSSTSQLRQSSSSQLCRVNLLLTTLIVLSPTLLSTVTTPPFNAVFTLTFNSPTISFSVPRLSASEQELVSSHYGSLLVNCFCAEMSVVTWSIFACCICHFFFTVRRSYKPQISAISSQSQPAKPQSYP